MKYRTTPEGIKLSLCFGVTLLMVWVKESSESWLLLAASVALFCIVVGYFLFIEGSGMWKEEQLMKEAKAYGWREDPNNLRTGFIYKNTDITARFANDFLWLSVPDVTPSPKFSEFVDATLWAEEYLKRRSKTM